MKATHAYIGIKACGCVVTVVVDEPGEGAATGAVLAQFARDGYTIERVPLGDARATLRRCRCEPEMRCECGHSPDHHADDGCWVFGCDCRAAPRADGG